MVKLMIIELDQLFGLAVVTTKGDSLGEIDGAFIDVRDQKLTAFKVRRSTLGITRERLAVSFSDVTEINRQLITVNSDAKKISQHQHEKSLTDSSPILGVKAKTESGQSLGRIVNAQIDSNTGYVVRYELKLLLADRLIPRQFLVTINQKVAIFKDIVNRPTFDRAAAEAQPSVEVA